MDNPETTNPNAGGSCLGSAIGDRVAPSDPTKGRGIRPKPIPIPAGGLKTNEDEARWLEQTILLRVGEMFSMIGVNTKINPTGLYDLLLMSLNSASKRGRKEALK